ncbi:hypothetical protein L6452_10383 [Arctium lappa]|uniref:Uncharacterized protein n=1 Tax=Arctium lappa TaxID=4217 RepID=A0ACB9DMJ9_ARCLA|nr:hypothetical protein L6452_10383 [Arctium lappa]
MSIDASSLEIVKAHSLTASISTTLRSMHLAISAVHFVSTSLLNSDIAKKVSFISAIPRNPNENSYDLSFSVPIFFDSCNNLLFGQIGWRSRFSIYFLL